MSNALFEKTSSNGKETPWYDVSTKYASSRGTNKSSRPESNLVETSYHGVSENTNHGVSENTNHCVSENAKTSLSESTNIKKTKSQIANQCGYLANIISRLKYAVTKYANGHGAEFGWQPRYHDRIVRSQKELNDISTYITTNVAKWDIDKLNL